MLTTIRLAGTAIGYVVFLMWVAGVLDLADFTLIFKVSPR